jgi:hypothetical protein
MLQVGFGRPFLLVVHGRIEIHPCRTSQTTRLEPRGRHQEAEGLEKILNASRGGRIQRDSEPHHAREPKHRPFQTAPLHASGR